MGDRGASTRPPTHGRGSAGCWNIATNCHVTSIEQPLHYVVDRLVTLFCLICEICLVSVVVLRSRGRGDVLNSLPPEPARTVEYQLCGVIGVNEFGEVPK